MDSRSMKKREKASSVQGQDDGCRSRGASPVAGPREHRGVRGRPSPQWFGVQLRKS